MIDHSFWTGLQVVMIMIAGHLLGKVVGNLIFREKDNDNKRT